MLTPARIFIALATTSQGMQAMTMPYWMHLTLIGVGLFSTAIVGMTAPVTAPAGATVTVTPPTVKP